MESLNGIANLNTTDMTGVLKYILTLGFLVYFVVTLMRSAEDPSTLTSNYMNYLFPLVIGLLVLIPTVFLGKQTLNNTYYIGVVIGTIVALFGTVFYFYASINDTAFTLANYALTGIISLGILIGLAIVFYFYSSSLKTQEGWGGFFVHLLFYVPCLILDFYNYIRRELELTTNVVYYLFITEVVLIFLYNYIPKIVSKISLKEGTSLLKGSAFLDIEKPLISSYDLKLNQEKDQDNVNSPVVYRKNYSLSMWIMLNPHNENKFSYANETTLFNYGNGVPKITYVKKQPHNTKETLKVYFTNNDSDTNANNYTLEIDTQKWNQFIFNYNANSVDLFVNGALATTFRFDNNNPPVYTSSDMVVIGSTDGVDGAISNIQYYVGNLSRSQVANSYNLLMKKNPPVNNL